LPPWHVITEFLNFVLVEYFLSDGTGADIKTAKRQFVAAVLGVETLYENHLVAYKGFDLANLVILVFNTAHALFTLGRLPFYIIVYFHKI
jgi:hypothetical protein